MATKKTSFSAVAGNLSGLDDIFDYEPERKKENVTSFEEISVTDIKLDPKDEFTNLYPLDEENINRIAESIKKRGFRKSQALTLVYIECENDEFLGDGHNRLQAAKLAEIEKVPVYRESYATRKEAKIAMLELQLNRRNLTDALKFKSIQLYMELKGEGKAENGSGKKSEEIAKNFGMSSRQIEKINAIRKSGDEELIAAVESGEKTINRASNDLKEKKKVFTNDNSTHLDSLEDSSEDIQPLTVSHTEHPSEVRDYEVHPEDFTDRLLKEKNVQVDEAFKNGFAEGFQTALKWSLSQIKKGRTPEEVMHDESISDLSVFELSDEDLEIAESL